MKMIEVNHDEELSLTFLKSISLLSNLLSIHNCKVRIAFEIAEFDGSFQPDGNDGHCGCFLSTSAFSDELFPQHNCSESKANLDFAALMKKATVC